MFCFKNTLQLLETIKPYKRYDLPAPANPVPAFVPLTSFLHSPTAFCFQTGYMPFGAGTREPDFQRAVRDTGMSLVGFLRSPEARYFKVFSHLAPSNLGFGHLNSIWRSALKCLCPMDCNKIQWRSLFSRPPAGTCLHHLNTMIDLVPNQLVSVWCL